MDKSNRKPRRSDGKDNRSLFRRTILLMVCLGILAFVPLVVQLYRLQIAEHLQWEEWAANQQTKSVSVAANRGTIYDCEGRALAMSATVYKLILSPRDVLQSINKEDKKYQTEDGGFNESAYNADLLEKRTIIVNWLAANLGLDEEWLWKRIEYTASAYEVVARDLEEEQAEAIRTFIRDKKLSGMLNLTPDSKRYYPYSSVASHVLGYMSYTETSGDQKVGGNGIEALYEDYLSGELGRVVTSRNGVGVEMLTGYEMYFDAEDGCDLILTLDERIQAELESILAEGIETYDVKNGGFGIVIDPNTGAILAIASVPEFDPNNYDTIIDDDLLAGLAAIAASAGEDSDEYRAAVTAARYKQWRNKALSDAYEPGSTFKPLTVAMALEEGLISLDDHYYCGGVYEVGGWPIHCHKTIGHGDQTLTEAVANSCNVALMKIAEKIGAETFWDYLMDYGFDIPTGVDLVGEGKSVLWNEADFKGPYGAASLATGSFGQTLEVTPIQMITAFASIINGGHLITPYIVQSIRDGDGSTVYYHETQEVRQTISESTSEKIRGILEYVVAEGSGHNAYMSGYRIAGKTGTSEKIGEAGDDVICSFMGYAPADNPQVLVLLAYDSPARSAPGSNYTRSNTYISGGNLTAPMAGKLIAHILDYMGVEKQYTSEELAAADTTMPYTVGYELTVAKGIIQDRGLQCRTIGTGSIVTGQIPASGTVIPGQSNVILYLGEEVPGGQVEVPDLSRMSPTAAKVKLEGLGLFMRATGVVDYTDPTVEAADQSLAAGTLVPMGTVVEVRFVSTAIYGDHG